MAPGTISPKSEKVERNNNQNKGKHQRSRNFLGSFMKKIRITNRNNIQSKVKATKTPGDEEIDLPLNQIMEKIVLPDFLMTLEEYQGIKIPQMKNFSYKEIVAEENETQFNESRAPTHFEFKVKSKKNLFLLSMLILIIGLSIFLLVYFLA